jgi:hypothetical protein
VKIAFILLLIASPLLFIAVATRRFGFAVVPTLFASVAGAIFAFGLFFFYNSWKVRAVLAGREPGAVAYFPGANLSTRITAWFTICAFGAAIGVLVLLVHHFYSRAQSA